MFDEIRVAESHLPCAHRPKGFDPSEAGWWQTKCLECSGRRFAIEEDGSLRILTKGYFESDGQTYPQSMEWTGELYFHDYTRAGEWWRLKAVIVEGKLYKPIEVVTQP